MAWYSVSDLLSSALFTESDSSTEISFITSIEKLIDARADRVNFTNISKEFIQELVTAATARGEYSKIGILYLAAEIIAA